MTPNAVFLINWLATMQPRLKVCGFNITRLQYEGNSIHADIESDNEIVRITIWPSMECDAEVLEKDGDTHWYRHYQNITDHILTNWLLCIVAMDWRQLATKNYM